MISKRKNVWSYRYEKTFPGPPTIYASVKTYGQNQWFELILNATLKKIIPIESVVYCLCFYFKKQNKKSNMYIYKYIYTNVDKLSVSIREPGLNTHLY